MELPPPFPELDEPAVEASPEDDTLLLSMEDIVNLTAMTFQQLVRICISPGDSVRSQAQKEFDVCVGLQLAKQSEFKPDGKRDKTRSAENVETVWRRLCALSHDPNRKCPNFGGGASTKYTKMAECIHKKGLTYVELPAWCRDNVSATVQPTRQEPIGLDTQYSTDSSSGERVSSPDPTIGDGESFQSSARSSTPVFGDGAEHSAEDLLRLAHELLQKEAVQYDDPVLKTAMQQQARTILRQLEDIQDLRESAKRQRVVYSSLSAMSPGVAYQSMDATSPGVAYQSLGAMIPDAPQAEDDSPYVFRSLSKSPDVDAHTSAPEEHSRRYRSLSSLAFTDDPHHTEAVSTPARSPSLDSQLEQVIGRLHKALEIAP